MNRPITPEELEQEIKFIPEFVYEAVNNLLIKEFRKTSICAIIYQSDIIDEIKRIQPETTRNEIFEKGWLNFEQHYRNAGWEVKYDKPGYNEDYDAKFTFQKER